MSIIFLTRFEFLYKSLIQRQSVFENLLTTAKHRNINENVV